VPLVRFDAPYYSNDVSEGAGWLTHTLELSDPSSEAVEVTVQGQSYASADMDVSAKTIRFEPGQTTATFATRVYEDALYEGAEVFKFDLVSAVGAQIDLSNADYRSFYGYIIDNDAPTLPLVRFDAPYYSNDVSESAGWITHTLTLSAPSTQAVEVSVRGQSYASADMDVSDKIIRFEPGQTTATFATQVYQDTLYEGKEVFKFDLVSAVGAQIDLSNSDYSSFYGYVIDDDASRLPLVRFDAPYYSNDISEGAGWLSHTLRLSAPSTEVVEVTVRGQSYASADLDVSDKVIRFEPGQTTATFTTRVYEDELYEGKEVFKFDLVSAVGAQIDLSNSDYPSFYGYVIDNDAPGSNPAPTGISLVGNTVRENSTSGTWIGTLWASDPDPSEMFTYTLLDDAGGRFAIQGNQLVVANGPFLDYEQAMSHQVTVRVTDSGGAILEKVLTVSLLDVYETPVVVPPADLTTSSSVTLPEGTLQVTAIGSRNLRLVGNTSDNIIKGNKGNNTIDGAAGDDVISGGLGKDVLTGGKGKDAFGFETKPSKSNVDTIKDFNVRYDSIWLDNISFQKLGKKGSLDQPSKVSKAFFTIGSSSKDKNDYIIYDNKKGVLYYDADGSGAGRQVEIAKLSKNLKLTSNDLFVI
jgi:hypothetical protein